MIRIDRVLQVLIVLTVCLSGLLLGMGQQDFEPFLVAIFGAVSALILVDWLQWFRLPQWLANVLAVIVTIITVLSFYFTADSVRQLLGVGKLLIYLQSILLFQRKSARVYWQVLVLSLLQIVVGAVFNLGFEGGLLFIVYMMVAGLTMMLLHLFQDQQMIEQRNKAMMQANAADSGLASAVVTATGPLAMFKPVANRRGMIRRMVGHFGVFGFGTLVFAVLLFYFLPREHSSWSGPREVSMTTTGSSKKFTIDHPDLITLSSQLVMNVKYLRPGDGQPFKPRRQPYLRGMAMSNLQVKGNFTNWVPPPYQVYGHDFRPIPFNNARNWVIQEIALEPTEDPLLYSVIPPCTLKNELALEHEWCWPLAALTRQKSGEKISVTHFRYKLAIPLLANGEFFKSVPYASRSGHISLTPEGDPGTWKWLTYLDRDRYPQLIATASNVAGDTGDNHLLIAKKLEAYLSDENVFTYALDFRDLNRDQQLDTVEDFVANHKSGHCEYFASALALMLRSQGIPSRLVVGYRGGDENEFGGHLDVEMKHSHAWVEAYIRPKDCTQQMRQTGQSNSRGAWLRLDPTPIGDVGSLSTTDDALDYAKSLWRDYVLGLQADRGSTVITDNGMKMSGVLRVLDLDWWQNSFEQFSETIKQPGGWIKYRMHASIAALLGCLFFGWYWHRQRSTTNRKNHEGNTHPESSGGWLRQRFGRVLGRVSPKLGSWVAGEDAASESRVDFYARMNRMLAPFGLRRDASQTHREFAIQVASSLEDSQATGKGLLSEGTDGANESDSPSNRIGSIAMKLTDLFYQVRYGDSQLSDSQRQVANESLQDLENCLRQVNGLKNG